MSHPLEHEPGSGLRRSGVPIAGKTVGEVLDAASRLLAIRFEPFDGPMWFRAYGIPPHVEAGWIVDVRIMRGETSIYPLRPKRDVSFPIEDSDIISIYIITD